MDDALVFTISELRGDLIKKFAQKTLSIHSMYKTFESIFKNEL
jgi:hypothetical protein